MQQGAVGIVGREQELRVVGEFLEGDVPARSLVLTGGPGFGKSILWEAGVTAARGQGARVLVARPSGAEAELSFAGLIDLWDGIDVQAMAGVPVPQRSALEVALLRAEPTDTALEPHAIALGVLNGLRALAAREPVLVAIDDLQWLDSPSAQALSFAARRLTAEHVGFLLATRSGRRSALERGLDRRALRRLDVGPLSVGATRRLLSERLGLTVSRELLRRIVESTLGNPLFALELGRMVTEHGLPELGEDIPVSDSVEDLLGTRVGRLEGPVRRLLLAVALSGELQASEAAGIADAAALEDAVDAEVVVVESAPRRRSTSRSGECHAAGLITLSSPGHARRRGCRSSGMRRDSSGSRGRSRLLGQPRGRCQRDLVREPGGVRR